MSEKIGKYVVIEGHDGTGKSTQVENLRSRLLSEHGIESVEFHEPGGNEVADEIRKIIKNGNLEKDGITNLLLFTASRRELWNQTATPALKMGKWVIAARSWLSSVAYQGYGEGVDLDLIELFTEKSTSNEYMHPDYEFILDLDDEKERVARIGNRGELEVKDAFESREQEFQDKVREGYLKVAHDRNIPILSASRTVAEVSEDIYSRLDFNK